jgi:NAD(P)-dependent dehydrogenase (short-subunit alcohol dehydrogenase family)
MSKTWLITGCSSGFGRVLAGNVLARGDQAVVTARNPKSISDFCERFPETAHVVTLDVTRKGDADLAVAQAEARFGRLDILVNNAGFGFVGAVEEAEPEEYRPVFETNLFGVIETIRAALPALRRSAGGRIVNFSSIGGITGRMGFGFYNAAKFGVEGLSEALSQELAPFGISVIIVEPGAFRTDFLGSACAAANRIHAYDATSGRARDYSKEQKGKQSGDPGRGVAVLLKAIDAESPPLRLPLGKDAYTRIRAKIDRVQIEMNAWEAQATRTDFVEANRES